MTTVKIYSTEVCPYCFALEDWFDSIGVKYEIHDASEDPEIDSVPVTVIGEERIVGFDRPAIKKALKNAKIIS